MGKEKAREKLKELIEKFRLNEKEYKSLSEPDVETKLIRELFVEILGWTNDDFFQQTNVMRGSKRGRADYEFRIGDKKVFYIEVKRVGIQLDKEADKQVISYALSKKNVPFAISTNFKQLKIFCVEQENAVNQVFRVFTEPEEYLSKFDDLWLLSKESFRDNCLLKQAEKEQRLKKRVSIDKYLLEDLMYIRKLISDDIEKRLPKDYNINEKDEIVQRILDRLIFIRKCEDVGINPNELILGELMSNSDEKAYSKLKEIFRVYNEKYNSGLFAVGQDNDCDKITISGKIIKKLIGLLYESKNKQYIYNFDWIDADVLGQVYEQYLGKILQQTKSGKARLKEGQRHRKEQGIYYTPTYVVDYIVKNTVGQILKERLNIKNLKILDPACGSGSFLIKAFDYLYNEVKDKQDNQRKLNLDKHGFYSFKTEILKNNLYGVDLDNKAVEITKLNLLLKAAEKNRKLPEELDLHIRKGNSLIDDESVSTKDYFKWGGDFQEGSFDVVIGNPPYIRPENVVREEREYYISSKKYEKLFGRFDMYVLFIEKALKLLKEDGYLSFIVPYSFLNQNYSKKLREWILKEFRIINIIDLSQVKVFEQAEVSTCVFVIQKSKPELNHNLKVLKPQSLDSINLSPITNLKQNLFLTTPQFMIRTDLDDKKMKVINKITKDIIKLSEIFYTVIGSVPHDSKTGASKDRLISQSKLEDSFKKYIEGKDMNRYNLKWRKIYLDYQPKIMHRPKFPELFENEKLVIRNISTKEGLLAVYDDENYYTNDTVSLCVPWFKLERVNIKGENITSQRVDYSKSYNIKYCLGLVNSKVLNFYFKHILSSNLHVYPEAIRNLPIKLPSPSQQQKIINLVDRILEKNKQLLEFGDKQTSETRKIQLEIDSTDAQIDQEVYKLYGLTSEEIKVVEENLN